MGLSVMTSTLSLPVYAGGTVPVSIEISAAHLKCRDILQGAWNET